MASFLDASGSRHDVPLAVTMYKEAADAGMSLPQYINTNFPTNVGAHGSTFDQLLASEGIFIRGDIEHGIRPSTVYDVLNKSAGVNTKDNSQPNPSRILFPAAILTAMEDRLLVDLEETPNAFDSMIAMEDSIPNDRFERPILNFTKPAGARSQGIAQLAMPNSMLVITASDVSRKIPTMSLGLEISDQAVKATTLDLVGLSLARQAATERNERTNGYILSLLNGDADVDMVALSTISGKVVKANTLDAGIIVANTLSQTAWIKWLATNSTKRKITHVVTDLAGAMAIENRTGRPTVVTDNPNSPRIDTISSVINPSWEPNVKIFLSHDANWPAGIIMGMDSRYGIHRVKSLSASYEAIEALVMRRATQMRFDHGEIVYRLFDEAFEVLNLAL